MENTLENKAKFFAQYWGQRIWIYRANSDTQALLYIDKSTMYHKSLISEDQFLELTPLSAITDDDAIYISNLRISEWANSKESVKMNIDKMSHSMMPSIVIDYLRSKGYAVDWLTIDVKKQLEWGWIKLKLIK